MTSPSKRNQGEAFEEPADDCYDDEYVPVKVRKQKAEQRLKEKVLKEAELARCEEESVTNMKSNTLPAGVAPGVAIMGKKSLLATSHKLRQEAELQRGENEEKDKQALMEEERVLLEQVQKSLSSPLVSVRERAKGIVYTKRMSRSWKLPRKYMQMSRQEADSIREKYFIDVDGNDPPPPILSFAEMRLPRGILDGLKEKGIGRPTQIQMQGIPAVLQGRDLIGIAFTGSGKTLVFGLPLIMLALEMEFRLPLQNSEGPVGLILCPSRELASQTFQVIEFYCDHLAKQGFSRLRTVLCMGGQSLYEQTQLCRRGCHIVVATPGRLNHSLDQNRISLSQCSFLCMDEADRMVDLGFEEEVRNTLDHFHNQRQTLLFSATMPRKIQEFSKSALVDPVIVNVGRAGAANLDVVQEVEYVKQESKLPYMISCLQKTPPPVLCFCESKADVDDVHEYLLLKGVEAVAIHGGLSQEDRSEAIRAFREGRKDVLIGTDIASKGLDFPAIQHVINYDMPREIENYVHRIGRTGRCGRTGVATTFINKSQDETILLDLKALLAEAGQRIPPFLVALDAGGSAANLKEVGGVRGCAYCGGLGHRITNCPKLASQKSKQPGTGRDFLATGSRYSGDSAGFGAEF
eukprot:GHVL01004602.1.p1 GENE.GHVL01004602.1~~GHVL01004602.1.p1  ORF type:complete len:633 (+),score=92.92 GHVL01004602.1:61-1959(+)